MALRKSGCCPERPYAARTRRELSVGTRGKKPSSLSTHDAFTLGYHTNPRFWPNAELRSPRTPNVRKRRSRHASCSCAKLPSSTLSVLNSLTAKRALVPESELVPGVSTAPNAFVPWNVTREYWPPSCVVDVTVDHGVNVALTVPCA